MAGLGDTLRETRQRRGLSLGEIESATRIRKKYLEALEAEDFEALPAPVYVKGFLRTYARYLGLDPLPLLALYPDNVKSVVLETTPRIAKPPLFSLGTGFVASFILILVGGGLAYLFWQGSAASSPQYEPTPTAIEAPVSTPTTTTNPVLGISSTPTRTPVPTPVGPTSTPTPTVTTPKEVDVPSFAGMKYAEAEKMLNGLGLKVSKQEEWNATVPSGVVFAQSPSAGQKILPGDVIRLTISKGPEKVAVPNVAGMTEGVAKETILQAGLQNSPWVNYQGHDVLPDEVLKRVCIGCVLSVTPAPGTLVDPGTVISIAVRRD